MPKVTLNYFEVKGGLDYTINPRREEYPDLATAIKNGRVGVQDFTDTTSTVGFIVLDADDSVLHRETVK